MKSYDIEYGGGGGYINIVWDRCHQSKLNVTPVKKKFL